jgi:cytochrome o ubiquinol oxidase subunit 2
VHFYNKVAPGLYDAILNRCVESNRMCMKDMMAVDARGGMGLTGANSAASLSAATRARLGLANAPARTYVEAMCSAGDITDVTAIGGGFAGEGRPL